MAYRHRSAIAALMAIAWLASLFLPTVTSNHTNGPQQYDGMDILSFGFFGPLMFQYGWFANILILPALALAAFSDLAGRVRGKVLGGALLLLFCNSLFWSMVPDDSGENRIIGRHIGYFLWMTAVGSAGTFLIYLSRENRTEQT